MSIAKLPIQTTHDNNVPNIEIRNYRYLFPSTTDHCTVYRFTYQQFFFQLFIVAPGDVPTPSWEHFCVHMNSTVMTQHLDSFYGCWFSNYL